MTYRVFRAVYAFLAVQFIVPALSYMVVPEMTIATLDRINRALGGGPYGLEEEACSSVWHMLAVGNVMALGFMCALMAWDLRRYYGLLPGLAFLKGFSAFYSVLLGFSHHLPMFFAIAFLDAVTTAAIIFFAKRARASLPADGESPVSRGPPVTVR